VIPFERNVFANELTAVLGGHDLTVALDVEHDTAFTVAVVSTVSATGITAKASNLNAKINPTANSIFFISSSEFL
jgi:hypothetical protein